MPVKKRRAVNVAALRSRLGMTRFRVRDSGRAIFGALSARLATSGGSLAPGIDAVSLAACLPHLPFIVIRLPLFAASISMFPFPIRPVPFDRRPLTSDR